MGKMEKNLNLKLSNAGYNISSRTLSYPKLEKVKSSKYYDEVKNVYKNLGGILSEVPINLRKWDIEIDGVALELDEYLHFNRYLKITLESSIFNDLPKFPLAQYQNYCKSYETNCISTGSYGGKWSNKSCEKQFGKASPAKVFTGVGSPRWKQRAFYDFVKDLTFLLYEFPLVRISIYDEIIVDGANRQVKAVLDTCTSFGSEELCNLIKERM